MEKIVLEDIERYLKNEAVTRHSQRRLMKGDSCLSNLISFYDKVDEEKAVDVIFLDFNGAVNTIPHGILLGKLSSYEISRFTLCWVMNWLDGGAQRVVVNGATCSWSLAVFPRAQF